ncbi:hypothetical protein QTP86_029712 [Hemibagrus guttatus]|nr:hypothetical protein QTP86_029712 [Hemibagrus guttatus]
MVSECVVSSNISEIELRRKLKYFFMSACEKYRTRGRKPWKLFLQIVKITIITIQLVWFGLSNEMTVIFREENFTSFKHLFLKNYQERKGIHAVYTKQEVHEHISFIIMRYLNLRNVTVGNRAFQRVNGTDTPLALCQSFYTHEKISPENETFSISPNVQTECVYVYSTKPFNITDCSLDFKRLLSLDVHMNIKAINLQTIRHDELPDCYNFGVVFDNRAHSGRIKVSLHSSVHVSVCTDVEVSGSNAVSHFLLMVLFDSLVIVVCLLSLVLCTRSVSAGMRLITEYAEFISVKRGKSLSSAERMEFINGWNILIIISDVLTVMASLLKICILSKELASYTVCSILLGSATLLVWIGVLRYLGFFQKYNILILTMRAALPSALRFSLCAVMIYLSYCFCGWIVLGPHNENFRSFHTTAYCLLSMINGDEVYSTFTKLRERSTLVWFFSRFYIYSFVSIFTYMVLSLFIAIITDTYEVIKLCGDSLKPLEQRGLLCVCVLEMGEQWTPQTTVMMSDPCLDPKDLSSISHISVSQHAHTHTLPSTHSYSVLSAFCTEDNIPQCVTYINQEASSLGLCGVCVESRSGCTALGAVPALNLLYELLQLHRKQLRSLQELEHRQLKSCSDVEHLQHNNSRLKDQLEHTRRENSGLHEGERQLHLKIRTLQSCLKSEKEEVQKLQSIIASRATQYSHDAKRKERECIKLKERLNQLLVDKRDRKLAIDVVNCVSRSDGKRGMWKTSRMEARHEGEMYRVLLSDYEVRQQALMQENAELKKLLQHIKKDMMSILSPKTHCSRTEDSLDQVNSEPEDECEECSKDNLDQMCVDAREQLTNSIRLQWRRLKNRMHTLDTQVISRRDHEEAMQGIKMELQQCTEFIHTQQQLLQQLVSPCDEDTAVLLNDGYTLEEKQRLKDEWRIFNEQKKTFERERKNFTEAAIRLGHERKAFEEDRALWLKTQFLNMTPFIERKRPATSHSQSSLNAEPEAKVVSTPAASVRSVSQSVFSTPKSASVGLPSTAELYRTLQLRPDARSYSRCSSSSTETSSSDASAAHTH